MQQHGACLALGPPFQSGGFFGLEPRQGGSRQRCLQDGRGDGWAEGASAVDLPRGPRRRGTATRITGHAIRQEASGSRRWQDRDSGRRSRQGSTVSKSHCYTVW